MNTALSIHGDNVWRALEERHNQELRFRSAVITSTALHTGLTLAVLLAPLLVPRPQLFQFTPVNVVELQAPQPQATPPPPAEEQAPAEEPEPEPEPEPPAPRDVPADLEAQRIAEEEEAARRRAEAEAERQRLEEEAERQRLAEEARRRREAEEAERRRQEEEEARRRAQPQTASRQTPQQEAPQEITQQAARGQMNLQLEPGMTQQDLAYLNPWINRVLLNINNNWNPAARPAGSRLIETIVHFRVDRSGRIIVGPEVRHTSGDRRYDDDAVRAVQGGGQSFPPLPQAYRGSTLAINLAFRQE